MVSLHYVLVWLQGDPRNKEDLKKFFSPTWYVNLRHTSAFSLSLQTSSHTSSAMILQYVNYFLLKKTEFKTFLELD